MKPAAIGRGPAALWAALCVGCTAPPHHGEVISSISQIAPATIPGTSADLLLAGTPYPVQIVVKRSGNIMELVLQNHGEPFEIERYEVSPDQFGLIDAAEEHFAPPLPLLKFPLTMGEEWGWSGTMSTGQIPRLATAKVTPAWETLFLSGVSHKTVKIDVDLSLYANKGKSPLKRSLDFWFEPKLGLIKRQFGSTSIREPTRG